MSFTSSGKALDGPDFVGRTRGSSECVKVVLQAPGHQEKAVDSREVMAGRGLGYDLGYELLEMVRDWMVVLWCQFASLQR